METFKKFIFGVCALLSIGLIGCQNPISKPESTHNLPHLFHQLPTAIPLPTYTPYPTVVIPTPMPTKVVDELADVMNSLILFNNTDNNFEQFMQGTDAIYQLSGNPYHMAFIAWAQTKLGLVVYKNAITNWTFPDNSYHDRLLEIKEAELYRIQHYGNLADKLLIVLPLKNDEAIQSIQHELFAWQKDPRNFESIKTQSSILKELDINPDDVNFLHVVPLEEPGEPGEPGENFNNFLVPEAQGL